MKLRLRYVYHGNWRKNEVTLSKEAAKESGITLGPGECFFLLSKNEKIYRFAFRAETTSYGEGDGKRSEETMFSVQGRVLGGGTWSPEMLATYAKDFDIELEGLRLYQKFYADLQEAKRLTRQK